MSEPERKRSRSLFQRDEVTPFDEERRQREPWGLRPTYWLLLALVVIAVMATLHYPEETWVGRFAPNFATDTLGILLTLVFVQRFLDQQDRARRLRASIGGLRKATRAIVRANHMWRAVLKGSLPQPPEIPPGTLYAMYAAHFTEHLVGLDPTLLRDPDDPTSPTWLRWAVDELHAMQETLRTVIVAYGPSLDPAYVEALDEVVDDRFIGTLHDLAMSGAPAAAYRVSMNRTRGLREEHFAKLLRMIEAHNHVAAEAAKLRSRRSMPRSGTIGIALAADADIRVPDVIERRLWNAPPMPASLRADLRLTS